MKKYSLFLLLLVFKTDLYGYIDPHTIGYVLQFLAVGIVGFLYGFKRYWIQLKSFFTKKNP